jgi:hypothetical protein
MDDVLVFPVPPGREGRDVSQGTVPQINIAQHASLHALCSDLPIMITRTCPIYVTSRVSRTVPPPLARSGNHATIEELFFFPSRLHLCFFCFGSGVTVVAVVEALLITTGGLS